MTTNVITRCWLAVLLGIGACQAPSPEVSNDRVERFFRDMVYGEDFATNKKINFLRRWVQPIRVGISGNYTAAQRAIVEAQMRRVSDLTGVLVEILESPRNDMNLAFRFTDREGFQIERDFASCAVRGQSDEGKLVWMEVFVGNPIKNDVKTCIVHEIMHAMGFPNHSPILPSILSPLHDEQDFTTWDMIALRVLYDSRLPVGVTENEALPIIRKVIKELRQSRTASRS